jgi:hypothetical protein
VCVRAGDAPHPENSKALKDDSTFVQEQERRLSEEDTNSGNDYAMHKLSESNTKDTSANSSLRQTRAGANNRKIGTKNVRRHPVEREERRTAKRHGSRKTNSGLVLS